MEPDLLNPIGAQIEAHPLTLLQFRLDVLANCAGTLGAPFWICAG
jgi:hypothetical protein